MYPWYRAYIGISHRGTLVGVHPTTPWLMWKKNAPEIVLNDVGSSARLTNFKTTLEDQEDQTKWRKVFRMIHIFHIKDSLLQWAKFGFFGFSGYIFPLVVSQTYMEGYYNIRKTSLWVVIKQRLAVKSAVWKSFPIEHEDTQGILLFWTNDYGNVRYCWTKSRRSPARGWHLS